VSVWGWALSLAIGGAWGYWSTRHRAKRRREGLCERCGRRPATQSPPTARFGEVVCEECATRIARNHRAGAYFFAGLGLLMSALLPFVLLKEASQGISHRADVLLGMGIVVVAPLLGALWIWYIMRARTSKGA
jgi:hypothetical protein